MVEKEGDESNISLQIRGGGAFMKTQQSSTAGLLHSKRDGGKQQYHNLEGYGRSGHPRSIKWGSQGRGTRSTISKIAANCHFIKIGIPGLTKINTA